MQMFPPNSGNAVLHASYPEQYLFGGGCGDVNVSPSKHDHPPPPSTSSFFLYPPHHVDHGKNHLFLHQHDSEILSAAHFLPLPFNSAAKGATPPAAARAMTPTEIGQDPAEKFFPTMDTVKKGWAAAAPGKKRSGKKDRHSKISTANGFRDRRMRLSLDIARKFFDLQDMLGYDKASKTVEWLLNKSKQAIKELTRVVAKAKRGSKSVSSMSECEGTSAVDEAADDPERQESNSKEKASVTNPKTKKISKPARKPTFLPQARESRAMARARARERTREKMWGRRLECSKNWPEESPREESASGGSLDKKSSLDFVVEQPSSQSVFDLPISQSQAVNSDDLMPLHNNDMINFFRQEWQMSCSETQSGYCAVTVTDMHLSTTGNASERAAAAAAACPIFFPPADARQHHQPHFSDPQFGIKQWGGYVNNQDLC